MLVTSFLLIIFLSFVTLFLLLHSFSFPLLLLSFLPSISYILQQSSANTLGKKNDSCTFSFSALSFSATVMYFLFLCGFYILSPYLPSSSLRLSYTLSFSIISSANFMYFLLFCNLLFCDFYILSPFLPSSLRLLYTFSFSLINFSATFISFLFSAISSYHFKLFSQFPRVKSGLKGDQHHNF